MKRTSQLLIFGGIFIMILGLSFYFSPIKLSDNNDYEIDPSKGISLTTHRDKDERVEGYFTILGGDEQLDFHIEDPYGTTIFDADKVKSRKDFSFTTEFEGAYTLFFGNKQQESGKIVFLSEQRTITRGLDLAMVGIGVIILILGLVGFYQERLKQAGKKV